MTSNNLSLRTHDGKTPALGKNVYVDSAAIIIGDVVLGENCSVWPNVTIRGDMHRIRIGARVSVQDGSTLHITHAGQFDPDGYPLTIGDDVTIGHNVVLHGCTIGNRVLIGIGSLVLDGAVIEDEVVLGAGSLVPPGKKLESGYVYMGSPCKQSRPISDREKAMFTYGTNNYVNLKNKYLEES